MKKANTKSPVQLADLTETLRARIYDQHNLLAITKGHALICNTTDFAPIEALLKAIDQANNDIFEAYKEIDDFCETLPDSPKTEKLSDPASSLENMGMGAHDVIRMDAKRSMRMHSTILRLLDTNQSLRNINKTFPPQALGIDEVCPRMTVEAFTHTMSTMLGLIYSMAVGEEHLVDEYREDTDA